MRNWRCGGALHSNFLNAVGKEEIDTAQEYLLLLLLNTAKRARRGVNSSGDRDGVSLSFVNVFFPFLARNEEEEIRIFFFFFFVQR